MRKSRPASTSAASFAIGTPLTVNAAPVPATAGGRPTAPKAALPLDRAARDQRAAARQHPDARDAQPERGVADVLAVARAAQRREAAALQERAGGDVHIGEPGERLDRDAVGRQAFERHAVADLAECLAGAAAKMRARGV